MKFYTRFLLSLLTIGTCALTALASPARRTPFTLSLKGGERVTAVKCGDEHRHWLQTAEGGRLILPTEDGCYRIASDQERDAFFNQPAKAKVRRKVDKFQPVFPTSGKMRSLVVLVNFEDVKMKSLTARQDFQRMMTEEGYSERGGTGSARDYYVENSMGVFQPEFDVVGPVDLPHGYAFYGENKSDGDDARAEQMIIDACRALDGEVDFTQYDYNNDGYIDNVFVFYAGYGEATTQDANTIWPHSWDITESTSVPIMLDGKRLDHYACTNELSSDGIMDGIGTFVHEFGHVLGLPDLYSTAGSYAFTPNTWSVMDEGEYNNDSRTPPYFTVFERYSLGWLNPIEVLPDGCQIAINSIGTNEGYIIPTSNPNEYFLLENRQLTGWDKYIPGHGMLVWHIDYDKYIWEMNRVNNNSTHQYVDIIEADNLQSSGTKSADAFPGTAKVTSFTAQTKPAFVDWDGNDVKMPLTNIREEDGIIYLDAAGGGAPLEPLRYLTPLAFEAKQITSKQFLASWQALEDAEGYMVGLGEMLRGEEQMDTNDFTGGLDAMASNWGTNVSSTFSNASYAGQAIPSLRMQRLGDYIECSHEGICGISFWCRGSSVKEGTTIEVEWIDSEAKVIRKDSHTLTATGTVVSLQAPNREEGDIVTVRILYNPTAGSGSLAIDDITVNYAENVFHELREETFTSGTELVITGLQPNMDYAYYVVGVKDKMRSRQSNIVCLHTAAQDESDAIIAVPNSPARPALYDLQGRKVSTPKQGLYIQQGRVLMKP